MFVLREARQRLDRWVRRALYTATAFAFFSGTVFYALRRWGSVEGDFGPEAHPWQQSALEIHGAAAFTMLMLVGAILVVHVPAAWRNVGARNHGLPLAIVLLTLVVTAWCMYYLDDPAVRDWTALIHLGFGLALPVLLSVHVLVGRVTRVTNARIARSNSRTDAGK